MRFARRMVVGSLVGMLAASVTAQPLTPAFTYQGELRSNGTPASGVFDLRFSLFTAASAGDQLGPTLCANNVTVSDGRFTVVLDFGAVLAGQSVFLQAAVRPDTGTDCSDPTGMTDLLPRQALTATPQATYSLSAGTASLATNALNATNAANATTAASATNASQLNGQAAAYYLDATNLSSGVLPGARLSGVYSAPVQFNHPDNTLAGDGSGLTSLNAAAITSGVLSNARTTGATTATANTLILRDASGAATATAFSGGGSGLTGLNAANLASGTLPDARLSTNVALLSGAQTLTGVKTFSASPAFNAPGAPFTVTSTSVVPNLNADFLDGLTAADFLKSTGPTTLTSASSLALLVSTATPNAAGIYVNLQSPTGGAVGVTSYARGEQAMGMFSYATSTSGDNYGLWAQGSGTSGAGIFGKALGPSGTAIGVYGFSAADQGYGGYFQGRVGATALGFGDDAIVSVADSAGKSGIYARNTYTFSTAYGVYGSNTGSSGYGVYANGRSGATGTKSFRIDHPQDPEHRYLLHYSSEGPEALNVYRGEATLDEQGEAEIEMPRYFAAVNAKPTYQLTAMGASMPGLFVSEEISAQALAEGAAAEPGQTIPVCRFRVSGGVAGAKVCWVVQAARYDRWVQRHGAPVEEDKQGPEDGTYQHPELYGQPASRSMDAGRIREPRPVPQRPQTK